MKGFYRRTIENALSYASGVELTAPARVSGLNGLRVGRRNGNALEFSEYREYQPGDDLRRLDWGVYARNEQLMVKLYSEEIDPRCDLIVDHSGSMGLTQRKSAAALGLSALLARAAENAGFSLQVWHAGETLEKDPNGHHPVEWRNERFDAVRSPSETFGGYDAGFFSRGIRLVVTDLMGPDDPGPFLQFLSDGAKRVAILQLLEDSELNPSAEGNTLFVDAETGEERELLVDEGSVRRYLERLERHRTMWSRAAVNQGALLLSFSVRNLLDGWPLDEFFRTGLLK